MKVAVVLLAVRWTNDLLSRIDRLAQPGYEVFLVVDQAPGDSVDPRVLWASDYQCELRGITCLNELLVARVSSWDRAIFLFENTNFDQVWFIEDDVFIPRKDALSMIDAKHPTADLLSSAHATRADWVDWFWWKAHDAQGFQEDQLRCSMACAIRVSAKLLHVIGNYAGKYRKLFFLELLFNSLANQNGLQVENPEELCSILWREEWTFEKVAQSPCQLFHPVKSVNQQADWMARMEDATLPSSP